jgi:hypothetical protein
MSVLFYIMADPETSVGMKASKILTSMSYNAGGDPSSLAIFQDDFFLDKLEAILSSDEALIGTPPSPSQ